MEEKKTTKRATERKPRAKKAALVSSTTEQIPIISEQEQKIREFFNKLEVRDSAIDLGSDGYYILNKVFKIVIEEKNRYEFDIINLTIDPFLTTNKEVVKSKIGEYSGFDLSSGAAIKNTFLSIDSSGLERNLAQQLFRPKSSIVESYGIYFKMKENLKDNEVWVLLIKDGVMVDPPDFFNLNTEFDKVTKEIEIICEDVQKQISRILN